jgi:hypothetical protein
MNTLAARDSSRRNSRRLGGRGRRRMPAFIPPSQRLDKICCKLAFGRAHEQMVMTALFERTRA